MYEGQNVGHSWGMRMFLQKRFRTLENWEKFRDKIQKQLKSLNIIFMVKYLESFIYGDNLREH